MYLPPNFAITDLDQFVTAVESIGAVDLVTTDTSGRPHATLMPLIWDCGDWSPGEGKFGVLRVHDDAPEPYLEGQLRGIVGITLRVTELSAKAKLS